MKFSMTGDCLIEVIAWACLTIFRWSIYFQ